MTTEYDDYKNRKIKYNFKNEDFRNRILSIEKLGGFYKKAIDALFARTNVYDFNNYYTPFDIDIEEGYVTTSVDLDKSSKLIQKSKNNSINYSIGHYGFYMKIEDTGYSMHDIENKYFIENRYLYILSSELYGSVFFEFLKLLTSDTNIISKINDIKDYSTGFENFEKIKSFFKKTSLSPNKIVMSFKTAYKITNSEDIRNYMFKRIPLLPYKATIESELGVESIILIDPKNLLKDKIFIMYKDYIEDSSENPLRAFFYNNYEEGCYSGERAEVYANSRRETFCDFRVSCDLKIVNKDLIHVLDISQS